LRPNFGEPITSWPDLPHLGRLTMLKTPILVASGTFDYASRGCPHRRFSRAWAAYPQKTVTPPARLAGKTRRRRHVETAIRHDQRHRPGTKRLPPPFHLPPFLITPSAPTLTSHLTFTGNRTTSLANHCLPRTLPTAISPTSPARTRPVYRDGRPTNRGGGP